MNASNQVQEQPKVKSYTERFADMEATLDQALYVINFQGTTIKSLIEEMGKINGELDMMQMVKKSVNAIMQLSQEGVNKYTMESVAQKIQQIEQAQTKQRLQNDLDSGKLAAASEVKDALTVVEFSSEQVEYGVATVSAFKEDTQKDLIGKKVGETVGGITITGLFERSTPKQEGQDEPKNDQAQA